MKLRTWLLLLMVAVTAYLTVEVILKRDPLARIAGIFKTGTPTPVTMPVPVPATPTATMPGEDALVLSAPPRDNPEEGAKRFAPFADYLSQTLGRKVVYRHPGTWGGYQSDMQRGDYDLVFDGPHFVSWRIEKLRHNVLVKLPGEFRYIGFVRADNTRIKDIEQFSGQPVCAHAPPNLGTMMLLSAFDNPSRQPSIVITNGYDNIYKGVQEGKCAVGMLPKKHLEKHDKDGTQTRVVYEYHPAPQQAFTAGTRVSIDEQARITKALMAPNAEAALASFREAYALDGWFVPAGNEEYVGLGAYLKPVQGFYK
ncbi:MAG TPA: PhnD/SsuA/transferrin family substrate-binding protein [Acidiferrobacterales bacterium]|nr:PhnD/SsuA/transferrin family substrate-binding protein [Acidiferrobacterales bacterium]